MNRREFLKASAVTPAISTMAATLGRGSSHSTVRWEQKLDGRWYFHPEHTLPGRAQPRSPELRDEGWPEIDVPNFWRPIEYWLWDPEDGASMQYSRRELDRVSKYRFEAYATRAGWYRRWIELPKGVEGKRLFVKFWAVAMISEAWWNGQPVGSHLGMFGPFECEVTHAARPGLNLITVFVAGGRYAGDGDIDTLRARGVTVDVSSPWLNDLPQSVFWMCGKNGGGGIWQSVDLTASDAVRIDDVFFQPRLDGARVEVTVDNGSAQHSTRLLRYTLSDFKTGAVLTQEDRPVEIPLSGNQKKTITFETARVAPKLWSPESPNLYWLSVELWDRSHKRDEVRHAVGFRTIEVRGTNFYLNDKSYYLRGATQPPYGLAPWDAALAYRYFGLLRAGNQMITAFNETGGNDIWAHAADVVGIGILDQGPWTWAFSGNTPLPPKAQIDAYRKIHSAMVLAVRNHPSILFRSINDEMWYFYHPPRALGTPASHGEYGDKNRERRLKKWQYVSDIIKLTRSLDPTRPICVSGGYSRTAEEWKELEPLGIDDGDFDNIHIFNGTYGPSYSCLDVERDIVKRYSMSKQPLISDQAGTGYPDNDIGFATRGYVDKVRSTEAWVGDKVYDPRLSFLDVNGQIIKKGYEKIRRNRSLIGGWLIFSNCQWFLNVYDARRIRPFHQIYDGVTHALEPVLVSLESANRHFVAGERFKTNICVVHDDIQRGTLANLHVRWMWQDGKGNSISEGKAALPDVEYYGTVRTEVELVSPAVLPDSPTRGRLCLELLSGRELVSSNKYPVTLAEPQWFHAQANEHLDVLVLGDAPRVRDALRDILIAPHKALKADWDHVDIHTLPIVTGMYPVENLKSEINALHQFVVRGGVVVFQNPVLKQAEILGLQVHNISTYFLKNIWDTPDAVWGAEYVDLDKNHPLADELDPVYDMRWWNSNDDAGPRVSDSILATSGQSVTPRPLLILKAKATTLCNYVAPHGYYNAPWDFLRLFQRPAVIEASLGKGAIIISTLQLAPDPISSRFLLNLVRYSQSRSNEGARARYF